MTSKKLINGKVNGISEICLPDIGRYTGECKDGKLHGNGILFRGDTSWYDGSFVDGKRQGQGCDHVTSDLSYKGEWHNDKPNGNGVFTSGDKQFTGTWMHGKKNGKGILTERFTGVQSYEITYDAEGGEIHRQTQDEARIEYLESKVAELSLDQINRSYEINTENNVVVDNTDTKCKVCFNNVISVMIRPCKHICLCSTCEEILRTGEQHQNSNSRIAIYSRITCPICRTQGRSEEIHLS